MKKIRKNNKTNHCYLPRKMHIKKYTKRFIEIDVLRGFAILLMVTCHLLWDLDYYHIMPLNSAFYSFVQKIVPTLFFILVGMCLVIGTKKKEFKSIKEENTYYKNQIYRGLKIFGMGMIITVGSLIFIPDRPVMFGVLHCIGLSIIISIPFLKIRNYNVLFSLIFIFSGMILSQIAIAKPTILHLAVGLHQESMWRYTVDYFPLLPWFGVCLLGILIGDWLYCGEERMFKIPDLSRYAPAKIISWLGQHSLGIYMIHQPLIAGAIILYGHL